MPPAGGELLATPTPSPAVARDICISRDFADGGVRACGRVASVLASTARVFLAVLKNPNKPFVQPGVFPGDGVEGPLLGGVEAIVE